jgi:hypothetical protein
VAGIRAPETGHVQELLPQDLGRPWPKRPGRHRVEVRARTGPVPVVRALREAELAPLGVRIELESPGGADHRSLRPRPRRRRRNLIRAQPVRGPVDVTGPIPR